MPSEKQEEEEGNFLEYVSLLGTVDVNGDCV